MVVKQMNYNRIVPLETQIKVKMIHFLQDHENYLNSLQKRSLMQYIENDYLLTMMAESLITDKRPPDGRFGKCIDKSIDHIVSVFNGLGEK